jgi:hypothetical protein
MDHPGLRAHAVTRALDKIITSPADQAFHRLAASQAQRLSRNRHVGCGISCSFAHRPGHDSPILRIGNSIRRQSCVRCVRLTARR